jgi:hypothetical protein
MGVVAIGIGLIGFMAVVVAMITAAAVERRAGRRLVAEMRMWDPTPAVPALYEWKQSA